MSPVCRFYIPPEHGDSHFLSASSAECAAVLAQDRRRSELQQLYRGNGRGVLHCAARRRFRQLSGRERVPCIDLWNHRADSNHRYTADAATREAMIARGYVAEGYGALGVAMCATRRRRRRFAGASHRAFAVCPRLRRRRADRRRLSGCRSRAADRDRSAEPVAPDRRLAAGPLVRRRRARTSHRLLVRRRPDLVARAGRFLALHRRQRRQPWDFPRASDPWATLGPDGIAYQIAIAFNGATLAPGSSSAVLASRSTDGGRSWSDPAVLIADAVAPFNDKESVTADPLAAGLCLCDVGSGRAERSWTVVFLAHDGRRDTWETGAGDLRSWRPQPDAQQPARRRPRCGRRRIAARLLHRVRRRAEQFGHATSRVRALDRSWRNMERSDARVRRARRRHRRSAESGDMLRDGANLGAFASGPDGTSSPSGRTPGFRGAPATASPFALEGRRRDLERSGAGQFGPRRAGSAARRVRSQRRHDRRAVLRHAKRHAPTIDAPRRRVARNVRRRGAHGPSAMSPGPSTSISHRSPKAGCSSAITRVLRAPPRVRGALRDDERRHATNRTDVFASMFRLDGLRSSRGQDVSRAFRDGSPMTPAWQAKIA